MIQKLYSIFDVKADSFNTPFFAPTNGIAIRNFADLANDPSATVSRHPADFKLVCIGEFHTTLGSVSALPHESLGFATDYIKPSTPNLQAIK